MDLEVLRIKVDAIEAERAADKIENLDRSLDGVDKSILKANEALKILRGELIQVGGKSIKLGESFTKSQANMLAMMKIAGASRAELKEMAGTIEQLNKIAGVNPFDKSTNALAFIKNQNEELQKSIKFAEKYNTLTKDQLGLLSRGIESTRQKAQAEGKSFGQREAAVKQFISAFTKEAELYNSITRGIDEKNKKAREEIALQKQHEAGIQRQKELMAQHEANLKSMAAAREDRYRKEVQEWQRKEQEKLKLEATAGDKALELFRKQEAEKLRIAQQTAQQMSDARIRNITQNVGVKSIEQEKLSAYYREQELAAKTLDKQREIARQKMQLDATMMDTAKAQHLKRVQSINIEIEKLREQAVAMRAGQSSATGNVVARLGRLGATNDQIAEARALRREIEELGRAARRSQDPLYGLQGVMRGLIPALGALSGGALLATAGRKFVEVADSIQMLSNRIRILSNETVEFEPAFANLKEIADKSRAPVMELGTLYARLLPVMKSVGKDAGYASQVTEAFALAMTISGTTAQEARSGLLQFSQAMSSATFNGDEFRAISEAVPEVLRVLEKQLGITRAELRKMSADGKLTSDIVGKALVDSIGELQDRVKSAPKTISQSTTLMNNEFIVLAKNINDTFNITSNIAEFIQGMSSVMKAVNDNRDAFMGWAAALTTVTAILGGSMLVAMGGIISKVAGAALAMAAFSEALGASKSVSAALAVVTGVLTLVITKYGIAALAGGAGTLKFAFSLGGLGTAAMAATVAVRGLTLAMMANPLFAAGVALVAVGTAIAGVLAYKNATAKTTQEVLDQVKVLNALQKKHSELLNASALSGQVQKENAKELAVVEKKIEDVTKQIEKQIKSREMMIRNAQANPLTDITSGSPQAVKELQEMTEEVEKLRNALYSLQLGSNQTDLMRNASRSARAAVNKAKKESGVFAENLDLESRGFDPKKLTEYNDKVDELMKKIELARSRGVEVSDKSIQSKVNALMVEAGLIKEVKESKAGRKPKEDKSAQKEAEALERKAYDEWMTQQNAVMELRKEEIGLIHAQREAVRQQGLEMTKSVATTREKISAEIEEAKRLLEENAISPETYKRRTEQIIGSKTQEESTALSGDISRELYQGSLAGTSDQVKLAMEQYDLKVNYLKQIAELERDIADPSLLEAEKAKTEELYNQASAWANKKAEIEASQRIAERFAETMTSAFNDLIFGGKSFKDVLGSLTDAIMRMITEILVLEPLKASLKASFAGAGGGGWVSAVGSFFGGMFADGGRPPKNKVSIVGERGPELFVPDTAGTVIPNHALMNQGSAESKQTINVVQNFTIQGQAADRSTQAQVAAAALQGASRAMSRNT
jgi:tape measure domain-containing protein